MTKKQGMGVAAEVGLAAASVAAIAGGYLLYGAKDAAKNRKKVKGWMLKAKGEILEKMETAKDLSEDKYHEIVDTVSKKYATLKQVDAPDLAELTNEAKKHWKAMHKQLTGGNKKKPAKKAAKDKK